MSKGKSTEVQPEETSQAPEPVEVTEEPKEKTVRIRYDGNYPVLAIAGAGRFTRGDAKGCEVPVQLAPHILKKPGFSKVK